MANQAAYTAELYYCSLKSRRVVRPARQHPSSPARSPRRLWPAAVLSLGDPMTRRIILAVAGACLFALGSAVGSWTTPGGSTLQAAGSCTTVPTAAALAGFLVAAPGEGGDAGGLFHGDRMWGAVVNRDGELCAYATNQADPAQVWPGSQAIAKAKAYTANAFSLDTLALSTARLYTRP